MKILLITPPMVQANTPYPATPYLAGFLRKAGFSVEQADLSLALLLRLFSRDGLLGLRSEVERLAARGDAGEFFLEAFDDYATTIDPTIRFLQGKDPSLALRISSRRLLPEGPRFLHLAENEERLLPLFGDMGVQDRAKYLASLYLDDLADVLKEVDGRFELSRYGESLAESQSSFGPLYESLASETWIDRQLTELFDEAIERSLPDVVGFTVPFPGNMYAALRLARRLRSRHPSIQIVVGGGFLNTELRELGDSRFFEFFDFATFDDGERPFLSLIEHLQGRREKRNLVRCKYLSDGRVTDSEGNDADIAFKEIPGPDYTGLPLDRYISMLELPNPMHRMWSDFRWNKLMLAHGCYWKRCTFCDIHLDYIGRFEPQSAKLLVDQMERVIEQTGSTGFHFIDEAAPPALLKGLSREILERGLKVSWWGNIRFDKQFTPELAEFMADAGCVAVTGGLEVASERLLRLIEKGVTLEQVARVTKAFQKNGIFVHAYLIYGFASQTVEETIDALEIVRQLFAAGCLNSATWHRFLATAHSPVGPGAPQRFGIRLEERPAPPEGLFAKYEIPFVDPTGVDHFRLGAGLRKALYNYMHGIGIEEDVRTWFDFKVPKTGHPKNFIRRAISPGAKSKTSGAAQ